MAAYEHGPLQPSKRLLALAGRGHIGPKLTRLANDKLRVVIDLRQQALAVWHHPRRRQKLANLSLEAHPL